MRAVRSISITVITVGLLVGSVVGVSAQEELTATWAFGPDLRAGSEESAPGVTHGRDYAWAPEVVTEASDPRLRGALSLAASGDFYVDGPSIWNIAFRIENEDAAWQQRPTLTIDWPEGENSGSVGVFDGEGAYAGLVAVVHTFTDNAAGTFELRGYVIEGEPPPGPEPYLGE